MVGRLGEHLSYGSWESFGKERLWLCWGNLSNHNNWEVRGAVFLQVSPSWTFLFLVDQVKFSHVFVIVGSVRTICPQGKLVTVSKMGELQQGWTSMRRIYIVISSNPNFPRCSPPLFPYCPDFATFPSIFLKFCQTFSPKSWNFSMFAHHFINILPRTSQDFFIFPLGFLIFPIFSPFFPPFPRGSPGSPWFHGTLPAGGRRLRRLDGQQRGGQLRADRGSQLGDLAGAFRGTQGGDGMGWECHRLDMRFMLIYTLWLCQNSYWKWP